MPREVVEASVFWGGDLFAVKYFAVGEPVSFDDLPKAAAAVEVRTRVVEAAPKTPRNRWDLPLGALAMTAAFMNAMVIGSLVHHETVTYGGAIDDVIVSTEPLVTPDDPQRATSSLVGWRGEIVRELTSRHAEGEAKPAVADGDTGMLAMLAPYHGDGHADAWAPGREPDVVMWSYTSASGWTGYARGGGGGKADGSIPLERIHTVAVGSGHGHLGEHHVGPGCHLPIITSVASNRLPPEIVHRIVSLNVGRFRACYEEGLRKNPALTGRVVTKFVIGRDGSVVAVSDGGSDLPDDGVRACVERAFMNISFPEITDGGLATVTYPIVMSPAQ